MFDPVMIGDGWERSRREAKRSLQGLRDQHLLERSPQLTSRDGPPAHRAVARHCWVSDHGAPAGGRASSWSGASRRDVRQGRVVVVVLVAVRMIRRSCARGSTRTALPCRLERSRSRLPLGEVADQVVVRCWSDALTWLASTACFSRRSGRGLVWFRADGKGGGSSPLPLSARYRGRGGSPSTRDTGTRPPTGAEHVPGTGWKPAPG